MSLPDEEARRGMLEMKLGKCAQGLQQADLAHMAACTQEFSGSDIAVLAGHLLMLPVRLTQQATYFRYCIPHNLHAVMTGMWTQILQLLKMATAPL